VSTSRGSWAAFAAVAYLAFLAVSAYAVAFLAGAGVPRTVDGGGPRTGAPAAVAVDVALLALFAAQHSVMARAWAKRGVTRVVPAYAERSTYVLASSGVLALIFWQWRPIPRVVWDVHYPAARVGLWVAYGLAWVLVVGMTYAIDHWELFGLAPVLRELKGRRPAAPEFRLPLAYRLVRHPMMTGFMLAFLITPHMSAGHLLFAALGVGYVVGAVRVEEHDLAATLPGYRDYAARTPRFVPLPRRRYSPVATGRDGSAPHWDQEPV
jgi:protein-S-isoprenylcysteine O-methyltransferase Ste14